MAVVQVYDSNKYLTSNGFLKEFRKLLADLNMCGDDVQVRRNYKEVDRSLPLLVLCNNCLTAASDINGATRELTKDEGFPVKTVAVIVVHEKDEHALPTAATRETLLDKVFDKFGLIVDFAFTPQRYIYKCKMNDTGRKLLGEFIQNCQKSRAAYRQQQHQMIQLYCQNESQPAQAVYKKLRKMIKDDEKVFSFEEISSIYDRDRSLLLFAVLEDKSAILTELLKTKRK